MGGRYRWFVGDAIRISEAEGLEGGGRSSFIFKGWFVRLVFVYC